MKVHIDKDRDRVEGQKIEGLGGVESTNKGWIEGERKTKVDVLKKQ